MQLVDSHCHPQFDNFPDKSAVLEAAKAAGVTKIVAVGTTLDDSERAAEFAGKYDWVVASAGVHPHEAAAFNADKTSLIRLSNILNKSSIVAVGEVGLDYYKNYSSRQEQLKALRAQIEATLELNLPYIFHIREAWPDFWELVDNYDGISGVIHSFTAHPPELEAALERNFYIGLNGIMTFTKDERQLDAAKLVPLEKLVLETDAPFLTPAPYRGQLCEPKHVAITAEFLAGLRGETLENLAQATSDNAINLFGLKP